MENVKIHFSVNKLGGGEPQEQLCRQNANLWNNCKSKLFRHTPTLGKIFFFFIKVGVQQESCSNHYSDYIQGHFFSCSPAKTTRLSPGKWGIHKNKIKWLIFPASVHNALSCKVFPEARLVLQIYVIHTNGIKWSMFPVSLEIILHGGFLGFMFHLMMALAILSKIYKIARIANTIQCYSQWYALLWFEVLNFLKMSFVSQNHVFISLVVLFVFVFLSLSFPSALMKVCG